MPADDATIFIDANAYLYFYQAPSTRQLVKSLLAQQQHIFITAQIVNEIERNKLIVAQRFFLELLQKGKLAFKLPEHLFSSDAEEDLRTKSKSVHSFYEALEKAVADTMGKISNSEDKISQALKPIFEKATNHSAEELQRARTRKELGYPPGKAENPIGDELNWEQLLNHLKGKSRIWIITGDSDFLVRHHKRLFLNPVLKKELGKTRVFCFDNLADGISDFAEVTGAGRKDLPSVQRLEGIRNEIEVTTYNYDEMLKWWVDKLTATLEGGKFLDAERLRRVRAIREKQKATISTKQSDAE